MNRRYAYGEPGRAAGSREDPLEELARIVNNGDPFANLFDEARSSGQRAEPRLDLPPMEDDLRGSYEPQEHLPQEHLPPESAARSRAAAVFDRMVYEDAPPQPANTQSPASYEDEAYADYAETAAGQPVAAYEDYQPEAYAPEDMDYADAYDEDAGERFEEKRSGGRGLVTIAAVIGVAVLGGGMAFAWKSGLLQGDGVHLAGGAPPMIMASDEPVKVKPPEPAAAPPPLAKEIFDRVTQTQQTTPEKIVTREEQPVAITPAPAIPSQISALPTREVAAIGATQAPPAPAGEPRRVRTVKVMADGTIVTGEATAPARPTLALDPPTTTAPMIPADNAPTKVAAIPASDPLVANDATAEETPAAAAPAPAPVTHVPVAVPPPRPRLPVATVHPVVTQPITAAPVAQPAAAPAAPAPVPHQVAALEPRPAAPVPVASAGGAYVVQVASAKSQADAIASFQALQRKFPSVIGGQKPSIREAQVGDRGTFFRVRVGGWNAREDATNFCVKLKAAGGDCVVTRN